MIVSIMQPTYLPWAGYIKLIAQADIFVYLDDAQYERGSWHQRNKILMRGEPHWITVPIRRIQLGDRINTVQIDDASNWRRKHMDSVRNAYAKHPFRHELSQFIECIGDEEKKSLADMNIALIEHCCDKLGISTQRVRASDFPTPGKRSARVVELCERFGAQTYVSPSGAKDYLTADGFEKATTVKLAFDEFVAQPYPQIGTEFFLSHLSIVDVVANIGWSGLAKYILNP